MRDFTSKKLCQREFLHQIIYGNILAIDDNGKPTTEVVPSEIMVEYAKAELLKLDNKNEKRRNTPTKTQTENEPIKQLFYDKLVEFGAMTANELSQKTGYTTSKISALCRQMPDKVTITDTKVKGKGVVKLYTAIK